jgi:hypothetical protein
MRNILLLASLALVGCVDRYNITVTQLVIDDDYDDFGTPEIEVYLFDANDDLLGCAGSRQGLREVDQAGVVYDLNAKLINPDHEYGIEIGGDALRFEVWEDDDDPVCPVYPERSTNDLLGVSPTMSISKWVAIEGGVQFGSVSAFNLSFD